MTDNFLVKLFEFNDWANTLIINACVTLTDEQLDAAVDPTTKGTIRETLEHLVEAQVGYLWQVMGDERRFQWAGTPTIDELQQASTESGKGFIKLAGDASKSSLHEAYERDGLMIFPWVVMVQTINHAHEHREQIKSMLTALGETPPRMDGWSYGEATEGLWVMD